MNTRTVALAMVVGILSGPMLMGQQSDKAIRREHTANSPGQAATSQVKLVLETGGCASLVGSLCFSPDGNRLAVASDKTVRIWDLETGEVIHTIRGYDGPAVIGECAAVAFSPNGRELVVGVNDYTAEGTIRVYDTSNMAEIAQLLPGHDNPVFLLAFSRDGKYLASKGDDGRVRVWDWSSREIVRVLPKPGFGPIGFPTQGPYLALLDMDEAEFTIVSTEDGHELSKKEMPKPLWKFLQKEWPDWPYEDGYCDTVDIRIDAEVFLAGGRSVKDRGDHYWAGVWATRNNDLLKLYERHRYYITAATLSGDCRLAATGDALGEVHVWETETGRQVHLLQGKGNPIYNVGFDTSGRSIAFGTEPYGTGTWDFNHYAALDRSFDLEKRILLPAAQGTYRTEETQRGQQQIRIEQDDDEGYAVQILRNGRVKQRYPMGWTLPMCYSFLRSPHVGFPDPVVIGSDNSLLQMHDSRTMMSRRVFEGHMDMLTAVSESPDGRLLASSSTDRTIRLWSLENQQVVGYPDIDNLGQTITYLIPGGSAERAGIKVEDRILAMGGIPFARLTELWDDEQWDFQPGQQVTLDIERGERQFQFNVTLVAGPDSTSPLLSLFIADDEWILWTPQGYYDASLGGDRLIGWHVNQGRSKAARFYLAQQFRKRFYRPDVIDLVLETGDVSEAVRRANAALPQNLVALDLRQESDLRRLEPPQVRILDPPTDSRVSTSTITVRAEALAVNKAPIRSFKILVNGRPPTEKSIRRESDGSAERQTISQQVELMPGRNEIAAIAANKYSNSQPCTVVVYNEAPRRVSRKTNLYLLAVGISKYDRSEFNLQFAHRDAEAFAAAWKRQEGTFYENVVVRTLTDEDATPSAIRDGMDWLIESVTQHDVAVLFLSAHGVYDNRRNYYLATHLVDPRRLRSTGIPYSDINLLIQDMPCKVLLFVDTCHSGGITGAKAVLDDPLRDLVAEEVGAVVFASSTPREVSLEDPRWGHGAFTKAFLMTLENPTSDLDDDSYLSLTELDFHLARHVKRLTEGRQHPVTQKPPTIRDFNLAKLGIR